MEKREIYLDNSATTRVFPEVVRLMDRMMPKAMLKQMKAEAPWLSIGRV